MGPPEFMHGYKCQYSKMRRKGTDRCAKKEASVSMGQSQCKVKALIFLLCILKFNLHKSCAASATCTVSFIQPFHQVTRARSFRQLTLHLDIKDDSFFFSVFYSFWWWEWWRRGPNRPVASCGTVGPQFVSSQRPSRFDGADLRAVSHSLRGRGPSEGVAPPWAWPERCLRGSTRVKHTLRFTQK